MLLKSFRKHYRLNNDKGNKERKKIENALGRSTRRFFQVYYPALVVACTFTSSSIFSHFPALSHPFPIFFLFLFCFAPFSLSSPPPIPLLSRFSPFSGNRKFIPASLDGWQNRECARPASLAFFATLYSHSPSLLRYLSFSRRTYLSSQEEKSENQIDRRSFQVRIWKYHTNYTHTDTHTYIHLFSSHSTIFFHSHLSSCFFPFLTLLVQTIALSYMPSKYTKSAKVKNELNDLTLVDIKWTPFCHQVSLLLYSFPTPTSFISIPQWRVRTFITLFIISDLVILLHYFFHTVLIAILTIFGHGVVSHGTRD